MKYFNMLFALMISCLFSFSHAQERYLSEVFDGVKVTQDVVYATNITVITVPITGMPSAQQLVMDIYEPEGDEAEKRPVIIMFHTGNFIPHPDNQGTGGTIRDSTVVGIARRLAKMGYVVASADYRKGWNPVSPDQGVRINTLINAAYRGVQDGNSSVRFFRKTAAEDGNPYKVDTERITLWGIGTGGYISLNTTVLNNYQKTLIDKFIGEDENGNPRPMVLEQLSGDPFGTVQAPLNLPNHPTYSSEFHLSVNLGGAMGDTSWLDPGMIPMISYQVPTDPFAPYREAVLIVPGVNFPVVEVQGAYLVQKLVNEYGNNQVFVNANIQDVFTEGANKNNDGFEGLYPLVRQANPLDSSPWDWWSPSNVNHASGLLTNPDMSFEKAMIFADTILGYFAPRAYVALNLAELVSTKETRLSETEIKVMPNPATHSTLIATTSSKPIRDVMVIDVNGRIVDSYRNVDNQYFTVHRGNKAPGVYFIQCRMDDGVAVRRVLFQ